jgi:PIN domain
MRTNYVLIDYENVQPSSLAGLDAEHFRVLVFVGAGQNKLTFETASAVQKLGPRAEYVKIAGNGSNALDFHIAFHIGHLSAHDPTAFFHIISKDAGFDPLIQHLKNRKVFASRSKDVSEIPLLKVANSKTTPEKIDVVVANLQQRGASKPRKLKTLTSTINLLFQKQLSEEELVALLKRLQAKGYITVNETKVTYALPASEA